MSTHALMLMKCYSFFFFFSNCHLKETSQHSIWKSQKRKVLNSYLCCQLSITVIKYLRLPSYSE